MARKKDDIGPRLEALALKVIEDSDCAEDSAQRLDGFKAVTTYYVSVMKIRAKIPLDDDSSENSSNNFGQIAARLKAVS